MLNIKNTKTLKGEYVHTFLYGPMGSGKCLGLGTEVMLYSGETVAVENVKVGDKLMGPDSKPRLVLGTGRGNGPLYRIVPVKGDPWVCNDVHVLTVVSSQTHQITDIALNDYLRSNATFKSVQKLFQPRLIEFPVSKDPEIDPYFLGLWYGDGTKSLTGVAVTKPDAEVEQVCRDMAAKYGLTMRIETSNGTRCPTYKITRTCPTCGQGTDNELLTLMRSVVPENRSLPKHYKYGSEATRRNFLAGFLDADGNYNNGGFGVTQKNKALFDDVVFVARSLGFRVTVGTRVVKGVTYWRMSLSGNPDEIPTRIPRKKAKPRQQIKDPRRTGFTVEAMGDGEYAGFELDGDGRFLLADFTVTHNTTIAATWPQPLFIVPANEKSVVTLMGLDFDYIEIGAVDPQTGKRAKPAMQEMNEVLDSLLLMLKESGPDALPMTVVFESLTHYCDMLTDEMTNGGKTQMQHQHWGALRNHFLHLQQVTRQLPLHVIYSAHDTAKYTEKGELEYAGPALPGDTKTKLPSACDIVIYCEYRDGKPPLYNAHFTKQGVYPARSRFNKLTGTIRSLHWDMIAPHVGWAPEVAQVAE